jgi:putative nucleotidyltransferase with HDIG domain
MLKKISVHQLTLGMHLKEFCGSWMDHPFWRSGFVLNDPKDIEAILASNIKEVWIDTSQGLDVAPNEAALSETNSAQPEEADLQRRPATDRKSSPVSLSGEMGRATMIVARSKLAMASMFGEARMGQTINTAGAQRMVEEISDSITRNPGALISLTRLKTADDYTYMHSIAVCALMIALARMLKVDEQLTRSLGVAGLLHDLGKASMPMEVLNKPGKLTDAEFDIIKSHPQKGYNMLVGGEGVDAITLDVCLHHHEKMDGSGYPKRLKGEEISLYAKMGAVCDVYDAITSNRPYKSGWDPAESLKKMAEWTQGHFDPKVFHAFVKILGIYPVGSLVRLTSGRLGVVIDQTTNSLTKPSVKVFFSTKSNMRILPQVIALSSPDCREQIVAREEPTQWGFPDLNELWSGLPQMT